MSYECILLEKKDRVATITLNRPERMNAWNARMAGELTEALGVCDSDDDVRALVLTGAGKAFCAGADLERGGETFAGRSQVPREPRPEPARELYPYELRKPVIAAINGHAIGVGITYPMLCDVRFVAEDAKLAFAFVRRGVIPELASHTIVPRVIGFSRAAELLLSGRTITGVEAAALGLASKALPAKEVLPAALDLAREFARAAPVSVAISKRLLWDGFTTSVSEMRAKENPLFAWAGNQPDAREGVVSFLERREPRWSLSAARDLPESARAHKQ